MAILERSGEQRVLLCNVAWETYERLLTERAENRVPRYTYDRGMLEIVSPLTPEHEEYGSDIEFVVRTLAEELDLDFRPVGAMTLRRKDVQGGIEADASFYIQNEPHVRDRRRIDLEVDPPPDLAIEIDITNPSIEKLPIYARLGVREMWRCDGWQTRIYILDEGEGYVERDESNVLPGVKADTLSTRLRESRGMRRTTWQRRVREWARGLAKQ